MPKWSMSEMTTLRWSFQEDVTGYLAAGFGGIGVWRTKLSDFGEERGADLLAETGMRVSSLSYAGGFTGSDGLSFRDAVDDGLDAVRLAAEIGAQCLVVVSGTRCGHTLNHAQRMLCDALREMGDAAAVLGVQIALQPTLRRKVERWSFVNSLDATLEVLNRCGHRHVGMVFDVFHLAREANIAGRLAEILPLVKLVSISDTATCAGPDDDRCLPGRGVLPVAELIAGLDGAGFCGTYEIQIASEQAWKSDYATLLRDCRKIVSEFHPDNAGVADETVADAPPKIVLPPVAEFDVSREQVGTAE